jgi:hypothetical protein
MSEYLVIYDFTPDPFQVFYFYSVLLFFILKIFRTFAIDKRLERALGLNTTNQWSSHK